MPVVAPRLLLVAVHTLLHHRPLAVVVHEEAVEIEIEAVLHGGAVDLSDQPARAGESGAVETDTFAERLQFVRRLAGMLTSAAANAGTEHPAGRNAGAAQCRRAAAAKAAAGLLCKS